MLNKKNLKHIFRISFIFLGFFFLDSNNIYAQNSSAFNNVRATVDSFCADVDLSNSNNKTRESGCYASNYDTNSETCERSNFIFDPFGNNIDLDWNYGNDYCLAYLLGAGITMEAAFIGCRLLCPTPPASIGKKAFAKLVEGTGIRKRIGQVANVAKQASGTTNLVAQGVMGGMPLDPFTVIELGIFGARCAGLLESTNCCSALATCGTASSVAVGIVGGIYQTAKYVFENVQICGRGWKIWEKDASDNNKWKMTDGKYKKCLNEIFASATYNPTTTHNCSSTNSPSQKKFCNFVESSSGDSKCSSLPLLSSNNKLESMQNVYYREYSFKGIEYEDNGSEACKNPDDTDNKWSAALGYKGGNQRYYFRGSNQLPNFACKRFLQFGRKNVEGMKAYICCNERSQNTLCLENFSKNQQYIFCSIGGNCSKEFETANVVATKYKIFESERNPNYICAKTYSSCPYDHNVQGGTDYDERFALNPKIITNFCQYMNHCIKKPPVTKFNNFDAETFFLAGACEDLKGDSQFVTKDEAWLSNNFLSVSPRHFSTPIVQCFKESLENNFLQVTGRTVCIDPEEEPKKSFAYPNGFCQSGYLAKKGEKLNQTFFNKIQNQFRFPIKLALVLSVTFFGFNILLATPESYINKKTIMTYLVKFGLVYFFVLGSAWQSYFMDSVMNISTQLSNITFQPDNKRNDGCIFPKYNFEAFEKIKSDAVYLSSKDKYITSLTSDPSYPLGKSYLRIWDTLDCKIARALGYGPDVSTPNLAKMIFSGLLTGGLGVTFFFAAFAYGFILISIVMRAIHITIMSIMGVILLIYVSPLTITCVLFERTKGIFENWWKQMLGFILQPMILFAYLGLLFTAFDNAFIGDASFEDVSTMASSKLIPNLNCNKDPNSFIDPKETSTYCILNLAEFKSYSGMEVFDLALPVLTSLNQTKINTLLKSAILMFVFFNFFDKITSVAKNLVGGSDLKSDSGLSQIQEQIKKVAKGATKRAANTSMNVAGKGTSWVKNKIRGDSPPKSPAKPKEEGGGDKAPDKSNEKESEGANVDDSAEKA